jgi:hypothetical protein
MVGSAVDFWCSTAQSPLGLAKHFARALHLDLKRSKMLPSSGRYTKLVEIAFFLLIIQKLSIQKAESNIQVIDVYANKKTRVPWYCWGKQTF